MTAYHRPAEPWRGRSDPEDGLSARRMYQRVGPSGTRALLGFCCDAGVRRNGGRPGASDGPDAIRYALASLAAPLGMPSLADLGDIVVDDDALEAGQRLLSDHVRTALGKHERLIVLGGGHETAFGTVRGLREAFPDHRLGIINLDAHLDVRQPPAAGGTSGTPFHQIHDLAPDQFDYLCIGMAPESNTVALLERATRWGVRTVFDRDLVDNPHAADEAIRAMAERSDMIYLSIDLDVLPHYQAPGVSAPATRGVPLSTIERMVAHVLTVCRAGHCTLPLIDLVELSPPHDSSGATARVAAVLALALLSSHE